MCYACITCDPFANAAYKALRMPSEHGPERVWGRSRYRTIVDLLQLPTSQLDGTSVDGKSFAALVTTDPTAPHSEFAFSQCVLPYTALPLLPALCAVSPRWTI